MSVLADLFYQISNGLLIPVMLYLLMDLLRGCWFIGVVLREWVIRLRCRKSLLAYEQQLEELRIAFSRNEEDQAERNFGQNGFPLPPSIKKKAPFQIVLQKVVEYHQDPILVEKYSVEFQTRRNEFQENLQMLVKTGPMFGLMGTLIPLGPALVGLAQGDLETMASNLIIAFATTVVGLLISFIGLSLHTIVRRWYRRDAILLTFAVERIGSYAEMENRR